MRHWTLNEVMNELPDCQVKLDSGRVLTAKVTGRANKFATLTFTLEGFTATAECAWATIQHCLNTGRPVRV